MSHRRLPPNSLTRGATEVVEVIGTSILEVAFLCVCLLQIAKSD